MKYIVGVAIAGMALIFALDSNYAGEKAKFTIKEVMREAHKGGLMKKVATGNANDDEKKELVEMYTSLTLLKPPAGEEKDWKEQTSKMLAAAKGAAKGDEKAAKSLLKIVQCANCHKKFKS